MFLGGPPLVKMATGEESERRGARRRRDARARVRPGRLPGRRRARRAAPRPRDRARDLNWRKHGPGADAVAPTRRVHDPEELLGIVPPDLKVAVRPARGPRARRRRLALRRVQAALRADAVPPAGRRSTATRSASSPTPAACCSPRRRRRRRSSSSSPTRRTCRCVFLHNTTGFMVGKDYEQGGIIKHGAQMINAVSNSTVPHLGVIVGASYGAGELRDVGPRLRPALPVLLAERAVRGDGPAAARRRAVDRRPRLGRGARASTSTRRPTRPCARRSRPRSRPSRRALANSSRGYDDGIIDPRDTRTVLGHRAVGRATTREVKGADGFGVFRM